MPFERIRCSPAYWACSRLDDFGLAAANSARRTPEKRAREPNRMHSLKNADWAVCFFFIEWSYGRGARVGRGRGMGVGLAVGVARGVAVGVAVALAVAVTVGVGVNVAVAVGVTVAVGVGVRVAVGVGVGVPWKHSAQEVSIDCT